MTTDPGLADPKLAALRELLPATSAGIYLATAELGPLPAETAAAMRDADDWELRVGRATEGRHEDKLQRIEEARAVLAALVVADPSEIVLTPGVEHALALAELIAADEGLTVVHHVDPNSGALTTHIDRSGLVAVDATLSAGAIAIDSTLLGADFIAIAGDRWLLGPEATGALWIGPRVRNRAQASESSGLGRTAVLGLARSVGWLEMYVALDWAFQRTAQLTQHLMQALAAEGIEILTPADDAAGLVCFRLIDWPLEDGLEAIRRRVFAIVEGTPDRTAVRASVAWFNTGEEIERFASAVREVARHTPDTLPQRPPIIIQ